MRRVLGVQCRDIFSLKIFPVFGRAGSSLLCRPSSSCAERGLAFTEVCGLLLTVASLAVDHRLQGAGAAAVARGLSSCGSRALEHRPSCGARA